MGTACHSPLPQAAAALGPQGSEHWLLRGLEPTQLLLHPDPTGPADGPSGLESWLPLGSRFRGRAAPTPSDLPTAGMGAGATTGRLCPGPRTQPGGLVSPGPPPRPECWVPARSPQWAGPAGRAGGKGSVAINRQTNPPSRPKNKRWTFRALRAVRPLANCRCRTAAAHTQDEGGPARAAAGQRPVCRPCSRGTGHT